MNRSLRERAFTLIEVVLALAVSTVALVSIIGLLSVAVGANGDSGHDTRLAAMSQQVLSDLRSAPFDALWKVEPRKAENAQPPTGGAADNPPDTIYYFTSEGTLAPTEPEALYRCVVNKIPDRKTRTANEGPYNQLRVSLAFDWPVGAQPRKAGSHTIYASIARY